MYVFRLTHPLAHPPSLQASWRLTWQSGGSATQPRTTATCLPRAAPAATSEGAAAAAAAPPGKLPLAFLSVPFVSSTIELQLLRSNGLCDRCCSVLFRSACFSPLPHHPPSSHLSAPPLPLQPQAALPTWRILFPAAAPQFSVQLRRAATQNWLEGSAQEEWEQKGGRRSKGMHGGALQGCATYCWQRACRCCCLLLLLLPPLRHTAQGRPVGRRAGASRETQLS